MPLVLVFGAIVATAVVLAGIRAQPETGLRAPGSTSAALSAAATDGMYATSSATRAPAPAQTRTPTPTRTPSPTRAPHWEFRPIAMDGVGAGDVIRGVWAVDRRFVAVIDQHVSDSQTESIVLTSTDGEVWTAAPSPLKGLSVRAGFAEHGTLRIVGRVPSPTGWVWSTWVTWNGGIWEQWGLGTGLEDVEDVRHLSRSQFGWLAAVQKLRSDQEGNAEMDELRSSEGGFGWVARDMPGLREGASITGLATNGPRAVVMTSEPTETQQALVTAWSSEDGRAWTGRPIATLDGGGSALEGPGWSFPELFSPFALIGYEIAQGSPYPRIWTTVDGASWEDAQVEPPPGGHESAIAAVTYSDGTFQDGLQDRTFVAVAEAGGGAWTSKDGKRWWFARILPPGSPDRLGMVAVVDTIVVVTGESIEGPRLWAGNLKSIPWGGGN